MPRMGLPTLSTKISEEHREAMKEAMKKYRAKAAEKRKKNTTEEYKIGEEVLIFSPKTNKFVERAVILSYLPSTECHIPTSYYVTFANNQVRKVNVAWISKIR